MLTPSMGACTMPLTISGAFIRAASKIVGTMSMMRWNWVRMTPFVVPAARAFDRACKDLNSELESKYSIAISISFLNRITNK